MIVPALKPVAVKYKLTAASLGYWSTRLVAPVAVVVVTVLVMLVKRSTKPAVGIPVQSKWDTELM